MKTVIFLFVALASVFGKHHTTTVTHTLVPTSKTSSASPTLSTKVVSSSVVISSSQAPSSSLAPSSSVAPSSSLAPSSSVAPSSSLAPSSSPAPSSQIASSSVHVSSMSISSKIAPSASSSMAPASSSKIPTTQPPTTPTTTPKPIHYDVDVTFADENTGVKCIWFNANMNLTYQLHGQNVTTTVQFNSKTLSKIGGSCSNLTEKEEKSTLFLTFKNMMTFTVVFSTKADKNWIFQKLGISWPAKAENNAIIIASKTFGDDDNSQFLRAEKGHAYSCAQQEFVPLDSKNGTFTVAFSDIFVQPFENGGNKTSESDQCSSKSESSSSSSIVPIAVGCALAGLIVIVLIAYLIGRRKNDGRGYQQV